MLDLNVFLWAVPFAALVLHLGLVRYNLRGVQQAWDDLMHRVLRRQVGDLEAQVALTALMADDTLVAARKAHAKVDIAEARRLLDLACEVITTAMPDRLARVDAMSKCCRMLAAVAPLPPLLPREFRMREMVGLSAVGNVVHHLLAGMQERFQWAVLLLGWGYKIVVRGAVSANGALQRDAGVAAHWSRFEEAVDDFKTLDAQHVRAFSALLASIALSDETTAVPLPLAR